MRARRRSRRLAAGPPRPRTRSRPPPGSLDEAAAVTLLVGMGARDARDQVLELADRLQAPMVLTLKAKEGLERDNPFQVGQSGLIGNPAAAKAMDDCDVLFLVGTDFPYRDWYPAGKTVVQLDARQAHIGRRTSVAHALVGDVGDTLARAACPSSHPRTTATTSARPWRRTTSGTSASRRCSTRATTTR